MTGREAAAAVREAAARLGLTWAKLAGEVAARVPWTVPALLGQQPVSPGQAAAAVRAPQLGADVQPALRSGFNVPKIVTTRRGARAARPAG